MHAMIWRGLQTAVLAGGFLAAGAGVAAAAENDLTVDVAGVTATVPVADGTVAETPVVTGTGTPLTATIDGSDPAGGPSLPVDTDDDGTTTMGDGGTISVPVTVTEADGSRPDPQDGLTVTVPVNTSDRNQEAGTTVVVSDGADGTGPDVLLAVADLVTVGEDGAATTPGTVLSLPVSAEDGADTTVSLPGREDTSGGRNGETAYGNAVDGNDSVVVTGTGPGTGADAASRSSGARSAHDVGTLAYTGTDPLLPALAGLLALGAGLALVLGARRRRASLQ